MKIIPSKTLSYSLALLCLGGLFVACSKPAPPQNQPPVEPISQVIIGCAAPLTGGQANIGKDVENGVRLAVEQANEQGTRIGEKKVLFSLLCEDDQAEPKLGPVIAQKLIDAKVAGVVGHVNSGVTIPASMVYMNAGIPQISVSSNPFYTEQGFATAFRTNGRDDQQGPALAQFLLQNNPKRIALIDDASAYGNGIANEVEKAIKARNVRVLPREQGTATTIDWKAVLTKVKSEKPDVVFYGGMDDTAAPLLKQARELGIKAIFSFGDGGCNVNMIKIAGLEATEGVVCSQPGVPTEAASKEFLAAYKARFKQEPVAYSPFSYDAARILIQAMKKAGSAEPKAYLPFVGLVDYWGATGHIQFDNKGDRKTSEVTIYGMSNGKMSPIAVVRDGIATSYQDFLAEPKTAPAAATVDTTSAS